MPPNTVVSCMCTLLKKYGYRHFTYIEKYNCEQCDRRKIRQ
jgi:hypothetical protein